MLKIDAIINSCVSRDKNNIKRYNELLENKQLPEEILEILEKHKYQLEWYIKQALLQNKKSPFKESSNEKPVEIKDHNSKDKESGGAKVINLKAI